MTVRALSESIDRPERAIGSERPVRASAAQALQEWELVRRAQQLDAAALSWLYQAYYPKVYNYAYFQLGDVQLAEDIASDVMVRLLESLPRFRFRGVPFAVWVFRIARNRIIDVQRRRRRRGEVGLNESIATGREDPVATAERALARDRVHMALRRLTEEQRQVILLKFIEGFDNAAVAKILARSKGAVKALQHRALASLRRILSEDRM